MNLWVVTYEGSTLDPEDAFAAQDVDSVTGRAALWDDIQAAIDANATKVIVSPSL